jgi:hypothetical protein
VRGLGTELSNVEITGELNNVTVNGVDIAPLVEQELNRRMPERAKMRPDDVEGSRRHGRSSGGSGTARSRAPGHCRPRHYTRASTASGRSSRPCATSTLRARRGSVE